MEASYRDFGFYTVDTDYLRLLSEADNEVYYSTAPEYERKPFLGIVVLLNGYSYFIPLTSAKSKHATWKTVCPEHFLLYEVKKKGTLPAKCVVKPNSDATVKHILAVLDIKKMIPVPEGCFSPVDFSNIPDEKYRALLQKEYRFCSSIRDAILTNAAEIYSKQKNSGTVFRFFYDFCRLETVCDSYSAEKESK